MNASSRDLAIDLASATAVEKVEILVTGQVVQTWMALQAKATCDIRELSSCRKNGWRTDQWAEHVCPGNLRLRPA